MGEWTRAQRQEGPVELGEASGLVWAAGSIWVVLGPIVDAGEPMDAPRHAVVLTTRPGDAPPAVLIPAWKQALEDQDQARTDAPGGPRCRDFTLVLGPGSLAGPAEGAAIPAFVETIAELEVEQDPDDERKTIRSVYLAKLDGVSVVVAEATASSPKQVLALRDAAAKIMAEEGVPVKQVVADCRIALVERMLHDPPRQAAGHELFAPRSRARTIDPSILDTVEPAGYLGSGLGNAADDARLNRQPSPEGTSTRVVSAGEFGVVARSSVQLLRDGSSMRSRRA